MMCDPSTLLVQQMYVAEEMKRRYEHELEQQEQR